MPLVETKVFLLFFDKACLNLAGIFIRPFESREYEYSPMKVFLVNVMLSFWENYPQLPTILPRRSRNVNIISENKRNKQVYKPVNFLKSG